MSGSVMGSQMPTGGVWSEDIERSRKEALAAQERGEAVILLGSEVFRAADEPLNAWHMIKIAQAERRGDIQTALAHFGDLIEQGVHPDDLRRLDQHMSMVGTSLSKLQEQMAQVMMSAAEQAGFGEEEAEDPTGPPESGPGTPSPTPGPSTGGSSSQGTEPPSST